MKKTFLVFMLAGLSVASAQPPMRGDGPPLGGMRMMEELGLTADQQKQVDRLKSDFQKKQIAQRAKIMTARVELHDLRREANPNKEKIASKISEIGKLETDRKLIQNDLMFGIREVLTPEQRVKWKERQHEFGERSPGRRKEMMEFRNDRMRDGEIRGRRRWREM